MGIDICDGLRYIEKIKTYNKYGIVGEIFLALIDVATAELKLDKTEVENVSLKSSKEILSDSSDKYIFDGLEAFKIFAKKASGTASSI